MADRKFTRRIGWGLSLLLSVAALAVGMPHAGLLDVSTADSRCIDTLILLYSKPAVEQYTIRLYVEYGIDLSMLEFIIDTQIGCWV